MGPRKSGKKLDAPRDDEGQSPGSKPAKNDGKAGGKKAAKADKREDKKRGKKKGARKGGKKLQEDGSEPRLKVRPLRPRDFDAVVALHGRCFPTLEPWTRAQFDSQLERFPEGQIGVVLDRKLVATSSTLILDTATLETEHTFAEVSDGGYIRNHDPEGDALYGIDIAVDPDVRGRRIARRLYDARKAVMARLGLRRMIIAGRMPGYAKAFAKSGGLLTPEQYVGQVVNKKLRDPVVTAQLSNGFAVRSVVRGYLPNDVDSRGCAIVMEWLNPAFAPDALPGRRSARVRIAAAQYQMRGIRSWEDFATQCEFFIDTAGEYRADFLLFPELLTNQLLALVPADRPALSARRLDEFTPRYLEFFGKMAIQYDLNIIAGSHLTVENGTLYNISYLFRRDGSTEKQYKLHITPAEARWWGVEAGDRLNVFDTDCGKVAILICYDSEFPELARMAVGKGAQVLFVPYNTDMRQGHLRVRYCSQARAIENHVYVVTAGAVGNLPQVEGADIHYAQSAILTPSDVSFARDGIEAEATPNTEVMLMGDLDLVKLRRTRGSGSVRTWIDRRTDLYRVVSQEDDGERST